LRVKRDCSDILTKPLEVRFREILAATAEFNPFIKLTHRWLD